MKILDINNKNYPDLLRKINNPPQKLYVVGDEKILNNKSIAIVGSRNCTEYGAREATKFSKSLTEQGLQIVSGLAIGIDSYAHMGCLEQNGKTIAVLGCGFNRLFPKENKGLFNRILESGGAVISEYSPSTEPSSDKFRKRNRIVSGLSIAVLVIEAAYRSGTTITAGNAMEQGKIVFCIPNSLDNNKGVGTNELLKKGASLVTRVDDILEKCNIKKITVKENINNMGNIVISKKTSKIPKEYIDIYNTLEGISNINEICKKLKLSAGEVSSKLLLMEMEGLVKKTAGNEYQKIL